MSDLSPAISVVVCTRNRADCLRRAVETLCEQTLNAGEFEIIVVDNDSTDLTRGVVEDYSRRFSNVRYLFEKRMGTSHARNCGWSAASGHYVAFMDDDCKAPKEWLSVGRHIIHTFAPAAFGGPYLPYYDVPKPRWYRDAFVTHCPGNEPRFLERKQYGRIYGGNMFVRRQLLVRTGGFDSSLGPKGEKFRFGEDTDLMRAIAMDLGERIYYDPDLYVYHLVRPEKLRLGFWVKAQFLGGRSRFEMQRRDGAAFPGRGRIALQGLTALYRLGGDLAQGVIHRDRTRFPYLQTYVFENALPHVNRLGWLYEAYKHAGGRI